MLNNFFHLHVGCQSRQQVINPLLTTCRNREILELGLDNEDSEHENDEDTNQSKADKYSCPRTACLASCVC